jgi:hypothetical protein
MSRPRHLLSTRDAGFAEKLAGIDAAPDEAKRLLQAEFPLAPGTAARPDLAMAISSGGA